MKRSFLAVLLGVCLLGCQSPVYLCQGDENCRWKGVAGTCLADGACAYDDEGCPSGLRYGEYAGDRARACVPPGEPSSSGGMQTGESGEASETTVGASGVWHVSPDGDDAAGDGSEAAPFATVERALEEAMPGERVELAAGRYVQAFTSRRDGAPDAPITIAGPREAVLGGLQTEAIVSIRHAHHQLVGFTVDGRIDDQSWAPTLVECVGPLTDVVLAELQLRDAGEECVRLRSGVEGVELRDASIEGCGRRFFVAGDEGKNGEGVMVGSPTSEWAGDDAPDVCRDVWIHGNTIDTDGNECVDVQEGATNVRVEGNTCTGQHDPDSGGISVRGSMNTVQDNEVFDCDGVGIRLGGNLDYGVLNDVRRNIVRGNAVGAFRIQASPQAAVCENVVEDQDEPYATGDFGDDYDVESTCD